MGRTIWAWALLALFLACGHAAEVRRHLYRPYGETPLQKSYEIEVDARYWQSSAGYDSQGTETTFDSGTSFNMFNTDVELRYAYGKQLMFYLGGRYRQVESTDPTGTASNSGVESGWLGAKYAFKPNGPWYWAADLRFRQSAYSNKEYAPGEAIPTGEQALGDDGGEIRLGGLVSYKRTREHLLQAFLYYNRPPNELSPELIYNLDTTWLWSKWALSLGIDGIYSLNGDEYSDNTASKPQMASGNTQLFNSINREWVKPYIAIYYAFKTWRLGVKGAQVVQGVSTDKGAEIGINILWNSQGVTPEQEKIGRFKEYLVEATVIKVSPRGKFVQIDKGISDDVEKGMLFDIYESDYFGANKLIATGRVYEVGAEKAIVRLSKKYRQIAIKKGHSARGY